MLSPKATASSRWRTHGVRVVRAASLHAARHGPGGTGRATGFDFAGIGGQETWIGTVTLAPNAKTGAHHHGRHEVAIYVVSGRSQIRWGERLEFQAEVGPGDFVYFAPRVPHQELNLDSSAPVEFVVVRSDNEKIAVSLEVEAVEPPETVY